MGRDCVPPTPQAVYLREMPPRFILDGGVVAPLLGGERIQLVLRTEGSAYRHLADLLGPDVHDVLHQSLGLLPALVRTLAHDRFGIYRHLLVEIDA